MNVFPFKPTKVYAASDSVLQFINTKTKAGHQGHAIATIGSSNRLAFTTWNGASSQASSWSTYRW